MTEAPQSAADPRPNDEPYYQESTCDECGEELVPEYKVNPESYDKDVNGERIFWFDEFRCVNPDCDTEGIVLDWPQEKWDEMMRRAEEAKKEDFVPLEEVGDDSE